VNAARYPRLHAASPAPLLPPALLLLLLLTADAFTKILMHPMRENEKARK
jgi:hypothetical protein